MIPNQENWDQDSNPKDCFSDYGKLILDVDQLLQDNQPKAPDWAAMSLTLPPPLPPTAPSEPPFAEAAMICLSQGIPLLKLKVSPKEVQASQDLYFAEDDNMELDKQDGDKQDWNQAAAQMELDKQDGDQAATDRDAPDRDLADQTKRAAQDGNQAAQMERAAHDGGQDESGPPMSEGRSSSTIATPHLFLSATPTSTVSPSWGEPILEELGAHDGGPAAQQVYLQAEWTEAAEAPVATVVEVIEDATQLQVESQEPGPQREIVSTSESTTTQVERVRSRSRERKITTTTTVTTTIKKIVEYL